MSSLGKNLLYVAVAGVLASGVGAWMLVQKYHNTNTSLVQVQESLVTARKAKADADKAKEDALKKETDTESALADAKSNADGLQTKLDAVTKTQNDLNTALQEAKDAADKATQDLKHVNDVLGMSPEDAKAAMQKALDEKTAAETEQKILADQVQTVTTQIKNIKDEINKGPAGMPPGISGKVTFVNHAWNFVVLDVGLSNGVVPKGELIVYRGDRFMGKVKVTSVEENTAVADILPDSKGDIQAGDSVLN